MDLDTKAAQSITTRLPVVKPVFLPVVHVIVLLHKQKRELLVVDLL